MESVLLVIHLIVAVGIIAVVLVQPSEAGGFLGSSGSMSNMMMPRRGGDVLTRVTYILAACFFTTSLLLAVIASSHPRARASLKRQQTRPSPAVEKTVTDDKSAKPADTKKAVKKTETPKAPISK